MGSPGLLPLLEIRGVTLVLAEAADLGASSRFDDLAGSEPRWKLSDRWRSLQRATGGFAGGACAVRAEPQPPHCGR